MRTDPPGLLARRLNHLFDTVHPRGRGPFSNEEVARAIRDQGGDISKQYIAYLRKGERGNPRVQHVEALAKFFGVPVAYLLDDDSGSQTEKRLEELAAWRDAGLSEEDLRSLERAGVTGVAMRAVGLSPKGLEFAKVLLDQLREMEGLEPKQPGYGGDGPRPAG
ncbi:transcriptional regulator with XRE-family HTH domain [Streptomyces sp. LBL]|uniref:helix-turn-helix domain-containing protein n=1 Tax=Streptomyces sp. LBL TaxID=2940562 RepID=UPI002473AFEA|nr:helix-turn-helix transcriptional regulator [Streptomyces sp. LBL]MDH6623222.1 transcriptional regulator with XRE-family HTH domain [Streptomyces sp. LBL]